MVNVLYVAHFGLGYNPYIYEKNISELQIMLFYCGLLQIKFTSFRTTSLAQWGQSGNHMIAPVPVK